MLDEKNEFEYYTNLDAAKKTDRPVKSYKLVNNKLKARGFARMIIVAARGYLYPESNARVTKKSIKEAKDQLIEWRFDKDGWFALSLKAFLESKGKLEELEKTLDKDENEGYGILGEKTKENFLKNPFHAGADPKNDLSALSLDKVIAIALDMGPLKQYYLVADCAPEAEAAYENREDVPADIYEDYVFDGIMKYTPAKGLNRILDLPHTSAQKYKNSILMAVAAHLIGAHVASRDNSPCHAELVSVTDLYNWKYQTTQDFNDYDFVYRKEESPLLSKIIVANAFSAVRFHREWFEKCNWKLLEEADLKKLLRKSGKENTLFYRDYCRSPLNSKVKAELVKQSYYP